MSTKPSYRGFTLFCSMPSPPPLRSMEVVELEEKDAGAISDGYHTFEELYTMRHLLFMSFLRGDASAWKSKTHRQDGKIEPCWDGWFLAGTVLRTNQDFTPRQISFHLPMAYWDLCHVKEVENAPEWDGHTSQDVINRLTEWLR